MGSFLIAQLKSLSPQFLSSLHLMDYSLIVGIHDLDIDEGDGGSLQVAMPSGADEEERAESEEGDGGGFAIPTGDCVS